MEPSSGLCGVYVGDGVKGYPAGTKCVITHSTIEAYRVVGTMVMVGEETQLAKFEGQDDSQAMLRQRLIWAEHPEIAADVPEAFWRINWMRPLEDPDEQTIEEEVEA